MASNQLVLSAAVIVLSVLAATSTSVRAECIPGRGLPQNPLTACHGYVIQQVCRLRLPDEVTTKERCCLELSATRASCKCEALSVLMDRVDTLDFEGMRVGPIVLEELRKCNTKRQRDYAATLAYPEQCDIWAKHSDMYCRSLHHQEVV
uniref:Uncharacterized protein n=1 Tax=Avena sativa TaxID=4498 RepID=A0ACD6A7E8_AVESA